MKKLLLVSLLAMGATSFAAVTGTDSRAEMPVKVRGTVIEKTGAELVIEPIKNAGVDGASMEFDFGTLVQGESQNLEGTFKIYRANRSEMAAAKTKVGMLKADGTVEATQTTALETEKVDIAYVVNSAPNSDNTEIRGTLGVNVTVNDAAPAGAFLDTTKKVAVVIEA